MTDPRAVPGTALALPKAELDSLLSDLQDRGFATLGPTVRADEFVYAPIASAEELPLGYQTASRPGQFRLEHAGSDRYFDATPGADSWKKFLFPPRSKLFTVRRENGDFDLKPHVDPPTPRALIGVRPCELAAIEVQDRVFLREDFRDPIYERRRQHLCIVTVDCHRACSTGFCHSMGTGPRAERGFDLALTELEEVFLVRVGSQLGADLLEERTVEPASAYHLQAAEAAIENAVRGLSRQVKTEGLPQLLLDNLNHPRWNDVAKRCLNCTNCTLVCPTCFCWDVEDQTTITGEVTERVRTWDSCFNPDHSYHAGGGSNRPTVCSRYRQWLTHKLGSWVEQFGISGCVGCGRCITWCPAGIDLTEEIAAIRQEE